MFFQCFIVAVITSLFGGSNTNTNTTTHYVNAFSFSPTTTSKHIHAFLTTAASSSSRRRGHAFHFNRSNTPLSASGSLSPDLAKRDDLQDDDVPVQQDADVDVDPTSVVNSRKLDRGAISMNVDELATYLGGWGRAKLVWDYYRIGVDPLKYLLGYNHLDASADGTSSSSSSSSSSTQNALEKFVQQIESQDDDIRKLLPTSRKNQSLGRGALDKLKQLYGEYGGSLEGGVARLSHVSKSRDGTTKLLIALNDGMEVETVIIPWFDKGWSTICIS